MPYFDYNATAPLWPEAQEAWIAASEKYWANPSALYRLATEASRQLELARGWMAERLACSPEQLIFTSGATENVHTAFYSLAQVLDKKSASVALSALEHPCVKAAAHQYFPGRILPVLVNKQGVLCLESLESLLKTRSISLVAVMAASNEIGTLQKWQEARQLCHTYGTKIFVDAVQWVGRLPSEALGECDFVSISSHKLGGPRGLGLLKLPRDLSSPFLMTGGLQEQGKRAGTQNVPGILAFLAAWQCCQLAQEQAAYKQAQYRNQLVSKLLDQIPGLRLLGEGAPLLWNTAAFLMPAYEGIRWVRRLDQMGFQLGMGAACSSKQEKGSSQFSFLNEDPTSFHRLVRISSGPFTSVLEWEALTDAFIRTWESFQLPR